MKTSKPEQLRQLIRSFAISPKAVSQAITEYVKKSRKKPKSQSFQDLRDYHEQQIRNIQLDRIRILLEMQ